MSVSSSNEAIAEMDDCVHIDAEFARQHLSRIRGEKNPMESEIAVDMTELTDGTAMCCHLDSGFKDELHLMEHARQPPTSQRFRKSESAVFRPSSAESRKSLGLDDSGEGGSGGGISIGGERVVRRAGDSRRCSSSSRTRATSPATKARLVLRLQSTSEDEFEDRETKIFTPAEVENVAEIPNPSVRVEKLPTTSSPRTISEDEDGAADERQASLDMMIGRLKRAFHMCAKDAQFLVEAIQRRCDGDLTETKRFLSILLAAERRRSDTRLAKRSQERRGGRSSQPTGEVESSSGHSRGASAIIIGDGMDRASKFLSRKASKADTAWLVCNDLEMTEISRTPELELSLITAKPPSFEAVRHWQFEQPPIRLLRKSTTP